MAGIANIWQRSVNCITRLFNNNGWFVMSSGHDGPTDTSAHPEPGTELTILPKVKHAETQTPRFQEAATQTDPPVSRTELLPTQTFPSGTQIKLRSTHARLNPPPLTTSTTGSILLPTCIFDGGSRYSAQLILEQAAENELNTHAARRRSVTKDSHQRRWELREANVRVRDFQVDADLAASWSTPVDERVRKWQARRNNSINMVTGRRFQRVLA